jgi:hypothetical protein
MLKHIIMSTHILSSDVIVMAHFFSGRWRIIKLASHLHQETSYPELRSSWIFSAPPNTCHDNTSKYDTPASFHIASSPLFIVTLSFVVTHPELMIQSSKINLLIHSFIHSLTHSLIHPSAWMSLFRLIFSVSITIMYSHVIAAHPTTANSKSRK